MRLKFKIVKLLFFFSFIVVPAHVATGQTDKKTAVVQVKFEGNQAFRDRRLLRTMITRPSSLFSKNYYHAEIFQEDLASLVSFYNRNGYLETTVSEHKVQIDTLKKSAKIYIKIEEGEITRIEGVSVFGNEFFDEATILANYKFRENDPFREEKIQEAKIAILTMYADNGFLEAEVVSEIKINAETHRALIDFLITEKCQYRIGDIAIKGNDKTKEKVIRREILFRPNTIVRYSQLLKSQRNLYMTGLFQSIFIRPQQSKTDSTQKDILVEVKDKESTEFNVLLGYGSVDKARGRLEAFSTNLKGTARKIGISTKLSYINQAVEATFTEPYTFGWRWKTDMGFKYDFLDEPDYNLHRVGGRMTVGRNIKDRSNISLKFRHDKTKLSAVKVAKVPDKLISNVRSLTLSMIFDNRDNMFNSTNGFFLEWSNEIAGSFLSGSDSFARTVWRVKYFMTLSQNMVGATALEVGWMNVIAGTKEIPLNERFYAGGPNSLRGFKYRLVGPQDINGVELGGQFKVVWNVLEIRNTIYKMVGAAVFLDVGNVWARARAFNLNDFRWSPGFGVRVNTPLGIIRLDYAINSDNKRNEPASMFYFNMGQAF